MAAAFYVKLRTVCLFNTLVDTRACYLLLVLVLVAEEDVVEDVLGKPVVVEVAAAHTRQVLVTVRLVPTNARALDPAGLVPMAKLSPLPPPVNENENC